MIYIANNTEQITFPKYSLTSGTYKLDLENNLTHQTYSYPDLTDISTKEFYYVFNLSLTLPVGEYTYKLINKNNVLETGLITYGDYVKENTEYNNNKTYKSYNG